MNMRALNPFTLLLLASAFSVACASDRLPGEINVRREGLRLRISAETLPPKAMDKVIFRVVVTDEKTGEPIHGGQGTVWGRNKDYHEISNGLLEAAELGTYETNLTFITAGVWQLGVLFRRDSTHPYASVNWTQEVGAPRPLGG
jgi:hypothetical protein